MKKVTCISYHNTGSGAVDDYLREFDDFVFAPSEVECRFLQDPDGISDLEYNLVDNWHRLNSGFAIKRFEKFARRNKHTYELIFGDNWIKETKNYINDLLAFQFPGYWHADINEQPFIPWIVFKCRRAVSKLMPKRYQKTQDYNYFPNLVCYHSFCSREEFYKKTRRYTESLCNEKKSSERTYLVLDQCVSTTNIKRYLNYIDDMKVIIVDRDPRDVYIQGTKHGTHVLPHDPYLFACQYRDMRRTVNEEINNKNVLKIQFEDLIYKYDSTTRVINNFLGISEEKHKYPCRYFDPNKSIKNTRQWEKDTTFNTQIDIIAGELKEFLYDFQTEDN